MGYKTANPDPQVSFYINSVFGTFVENPSVEMLGNRFSPKKKKKMVWEGNTFRGKDKSLVDAVVEHGISS